MRLTKGKIKKMLQKKNQTKKNNRPLKRLPLNNSSAPYLAFDKATEAFTANKLEDLTTPSRTLFLLTGNT